MKILVGSLFIAFAVFPNSVELSGQPGNESPQWPDPAAEPPPEPGKYWVGMKITNRKPPEHLRFKDGRGNLHPLPPRVRLQIWFGYYIGIIIHEKDVIPLYNNNGEVIMQDIEDSESFIVIGLDGARKFGIPGTIQEVDAIIAFRVARYNRACEAAAARQAAGNQDGPGGTSGGQRGQSNRRRNT